MSSYAPDLLAVGEHECVTCTRCALTFAAAHPACPRCAEQWRGEQRLERLEEALRLADQEASVAHDAIWRTEVPSNLWLHDNDEPLSAQSAIWRLHEIVRPLLVKETAQ